MGGKEIPVLPKPETNGLEILTGVEREILTLVNQHRAANGLKPLAWDNTLGESARYKSAAMIQYNYFAHENPQLNGMSASSLIWEKYGAKFYTVGENIAARMGPKGTALQLFTQWKESDGHNKNMLNSRYTHMGVGVVYSPKAGSYFHNMATTSATQHFGG